MKYSVIVPTFNSIQFMEPVFKFIDKQERTDIEFIFVDDCSTDNTYEKLTEYSEKTKVETYVYRNDVNSGPGIARNKGMEKANGEWIVFLDSDDALAEDFFSKIDDTIEKYTPDCVLYDSEVYDRNNRAVQRPVTVYGKREGRISPEDAVAYAIPGIRKCFKKSLIEEGNIKFNSFKRGEDLIFYNQLYVCKPDLKLYYLKQNLYYIHQRDGSLSNGAETFNIMPQVYAYLREKMPEKYKPYIDISSVRMLLYGGVLQMVKNGDNDKEIIQFIKEYELEFPDWYHSEGYIILGKAKRTFLYCVKKKWIKIIHLYVKLHKYYTTR